MTQKRGYLLGENIKGSSFEEYSSNYEEKSLKNFPYSS
jgi:hypothetical protein